MNQHKYRWLDLMKWVGRKPTYVRRWKTVWDVEGYKKKLPEYEKKQ